MPVSQTCFRNGCQAKLAYMVHVYNKYHNLIKAFLSCKDCLIPEAIADIFNEKRGKAGQAAEIVIRSIDIVTEVTTKCV